MQAYFPENGVSGESKRSESGHTACTCNQALFFSSGSRRKEESRRIFFSPRLHRLSLKKKVGKKTVKCSALRLLAFGTGLRHSTSLFTTEPKKSYRANFQDHPETPTEIYTCLIKYQVKIPTKRPPSPLLYVV